MRSNAKRHLRTHGVIPPPALPSHNTTTPYVVGFSPPVIAPAHNASMKSEPAELPTSFEGSSDASTIGNGSGPPKRASRTPVFKLRWMPPSLTTRSNAAKLKAVDEMTGEVSDDEYGSEEGEDVYGSDRDDEPGSRGGHGRDGGGYGDAGKDSRFLPSLGGIVLPTLSVPMSGAGSGSMGSSVASTSNSYSLNSSCVCTLYPCLLSPCRSLTSGSAPGADSPFGMGGYGTRHSSEYGVSMSGFGSAGGYGMGFTGMGHSSVSSSGSGFYGGHQNHRLLASA